MTNSNVQLHPPSEKKTLWAWAIGTFYRAEITDSHDYDVVARILE